MAAADYFVENGTSIGFDAVWRKTEAVAELHEVRNIKPGFKFGLRTGVLNAGLESMVNGATPWTLRNKATFPLEKLAEYESPNRHWVTRDLPPRDRLSSVFFAVTAHDESSQFICTYDRNICTTCATEYGNPCTRFCPARLRDGRRRQRRQAAGQRSELRALQGLRYQGPVPDHRMGDAGRRSGPNYQLL
jgi:electron-transferring-flavoprotein dehydrogenase